MDLEWLEDLTEVAARGSISEAAAVRGLNQSSLSRRIKALEMWCGAELFDRNSMPLKLTNAGQEFHKQAIAIVRSVRDAQNAVKRMVRGQDVRIVALHTLAATFVPSFLRAVRANMHVGEFEIKTLTSAGDIVDCVEALSYGNAHFMVSYENDRHRVQIPALSAEDVESATVARDKLVPVCSSEQLEPFRRRMEIGERIPYACYSPGTYLERLVTARIAEAGLEERLERVDEAQMSETLRNLAREGQGIAWVLQSTAMRSLRGRGNSLRGRGKKKEPELVSFDRTGSLHIDLEIKLFRSMQNTSPMVERVWAIAKTLKDELTPATLVLDAED